MTIEEAAAGAIHIVEHQMAELLQKMSLEQGHDPRNFTVLAYGGAASLHATAYARALGATKVFAWPGAEVAVMGAVAAVRILHRRKLLEVPPDLRGQVEADLALEHERIAGGVQAAVDLGVVDEIVAPEDTREALAVALAEALAADPGVRGAHGNIPL